MITRKTIVLTIQSFVGKGMPLIFNTLFTFVTAFLPRSKRLLILRLQTLQRLITIQGGRINSVRHVCVFWLRTQTCIFHLGPPREPGIPPSNSEHTERSHLHFWGCFPIKGIWAPWRSSWSLACGTENVRWTRNNQLVTPVSKGK